MPYKALVEKSKKDWAIGLSTAAVGGAVANQVPPVRIHRKKKGKVKKAYAPTSSDPYFNAEAAQKAFDLVMKMDEPTARMFTTIVVSDAFEDDINNNLETIQKRLNVVFAKRAEKIKKALVTSAMHSPPDQLETFAKAYEALEEISKAPHNPQYYGYTWDPSDFRRDPGSGRFMVKVKHTMKHPLSGQQEQDVIGTTAPAEMSRAQKAKYQDEYRQVAAFLGGVAAIGGGQSGDTDVIYHYKDQAGNNFTHRSNSGDAPDAVLKDPNTTLVAMEARPKTLTAGGAAYGLMGGMTQDQVQRTNAVFSEDPKTSLAGKFSDDWADAGAGDQTNRRLFDRLNASGTFLNQAAMPGSKVQLAGKFAQVVGQYGPEAEKVIGPTARKTAYRYRGTERAPDKELVSVYGREIQDAKKYGMTEDQADKRLLGFGTRREMARGDFTGMGARRQTGAREVRLPPVTPSINQMGRDRAGEAQMMMREPSWAERGGGAAVTAEYLRRRLPNKHLYKLHIMAGNTPPSEGVIINSQGQLVHQAVGYGDDHYLPFNLKNLGDLKGGEYIRTRSMGGLTTEDVYTGLISGARRVTVVSHSGTFSMEFEPDFRGGRRHNDKAKRMTSRYAAILDAVQSGKVERQPVPKEWKAEIKREVLNDEYFRNARKEVQMDEYEARLKDFKENPKIETRDLERAETMIQQFEERAARGEVSEQAAKDFRTQTMNSLYNMKEVKFRLNGVGYEAALKSLQEQFPYYIKDVKTRPTKDEETLEFTLDEGYVEPGRNRPTKANAGYFGTKENPGVEFLSASQVDYQRGKATKKGERAAAASTPESQAAETTPAGSTGSTDAAARNRQRLNDMVAREEGAREATDNAVRLRQDILTGISADGWVNGKPDFMDMDDDQFRVWLNEKPKNQTDFDKYLSDNAEVWSTQGPGGIGGFPVKYNRYKQAAGRVRANPYSRDKADSWPDIPFTFDLPKNAYHAGARPAEIDGELRDLDRKTTLLTTRTKLSELSDSEQRTEHTRLKTLRQGKASGQSVKDLLAVNRQHSPDAPSDTALEPIFASDKSIAEHLDKLHQARYLRSMKKVENKPPAAQPARGAGGGTSGGGSTPPADGGTPSPSGGGAPAPKLDPNDPLAGLSHPADLATALPSREQLEADVDHARSELKRKGRDGALTEADQAARSALNDFKMRLGQEPHITSPEKLNEMLEEAAGDTSAVGWVRKTHYYGIKPRANT